jgi:hypothetical protein
MEDDVIAADHGVLLVLTDLPKSEEAEINEWYNRQHVPDRVPGLPGFRLAVRYELIRGNLPKYMAYYETDSSKTLISQTYLNLVSNRDPLTDRILPLFQNTIRTVGTLVKTQRVGFGSHRLVLPIRPSSGNGPLLGKALSDGLLADISARRHIVGTALMVRNDEALASSAKVHARTNDRSFDIVVLVDMTSSDVELTAADFDLIAELGGTWEPPATYRTTMFAAATGNA